MGCTTFITYNIYIHPLKVVDHVADINLLISYEGYVSTEAVLRINYLVKGWYIGYYLDIVPIPGSVVCPFGFPVYQD